MVDRVKLIPFKARFAVTPENTHFVDSLRKEHLSEVFSWIVEGSRLFYASGMGEVPKCCIETLEEYVDEADNVARFVAAELESVGISPAEKKKHRMERQYVHFLYTKYTEGEREDPVTKRVFYKQMSDTFDTCKSDAKRYFIGVRAKPVDFDDDQAGSGGS
jgi:phage/plasmid-associated DNA primase